MTNFSKRMKGQTFQKKSKCSLEKNERTNILKNIKMHFGDKTNGQTFRKKAKFSFEKSSFEFKKRKDKHLKKKSKCSLVNNEQTNISKNSKMQFGEKNERANISKNRQKYF